MNGLYLILLLGTISIAAAAGPHFWSGAGADLNWETAENWKFGIVPGADGECQAVVSRGTTAERPVSIRSHQEFHSAVHLWIRNASHVQVNEGGDVVLRRLSVGLHGGGYFVQTGGAVSVENSGRTIEVGGGEEEAVYSVSAGSLITTGNMEVLRNGVFSVTGKAASVQIGDKGNDWLGLHEGGGLEFIFGPEGITPIDVGGTFSIASEQALLTVDVSELVANGVYELVTFQSLEGRFNETNIKIIDEKEGRRAFLSYEDDRLCLQLAGEPETLGLIVACR